MPCGSTLSAKAVDVDGFNCKPGRGRRRRGSSARMRPRRRRCPAATGRPCRPHICVHEAHRAGTAAPQSFNSFLTQSLFSIPVERGQRFQQGATSEPVRGTTNGGMPATGCSRPIVWAQSFGRSWRSMSHRMSRRMSHRISHCRCGRHTGVTAARRNNGDAQVGVEAGLALPSRFQLHCGRQVGVVTREEQVEHEQARLVRRVHRPCSAGSKDVCDDLMSTIRCRRSDVDECKCREQVRIAGSAARSVVSNTA